MCDCSLQIKTRLAIAINGLSNLGWLNEDKDRVYKNIISCLDDIKICNVCTKTIKDKEYNCFDCDKGRKILDYKEKLNIMEDRNESY